jgi:hypothetical protein
LAEVRVEDWTIWKPIIGIEVAAFRIAILIEVGRGSAQSLGIGVPTAIIGLGEIDIDIGAAEFIDRGLARRLKVIGSTEFFGRPNRTSRLRPALGL